ncbi:MAG TPA: hypothetical protein PLO61_09965 [Fimbriimonadaceae bacterium]|nr:hypothetical protein [Fimbriimonadaceae bacterium]
MGWVLAGCNANPAAESGTRVPLSEEEKVFAEAVRLGVPLKSSDLDLPKPQPNEDAAPIFEEISKLISKDKKFEPDLKKLEEVTKDRVATEAELKRFAPYFDASASLATKKIYVPRKPWVAGYSKTLEPNLEIHLRHVAILIVRRAENRLAAKNFEGTLSDLRLALKIPDLLWQDHSFFSCLMASQISMRVHQVIRDMASFMRRDSRFLQSLLGISKEPVIPTLRATFRAELFPMIQTLSYIDQTKRKEPSEVTEAELPNNPVTKLAYIDLIRAANQIFRRGEEASWDEKAIEDALQEIYADLDVTPRPAKLFLKEILPTWAKALTRQRIAIARAALTRCYLALLIDQQVSNRFRSDLRAFPVYGRDPFSPLQPLMLKKNKEGMILYSVGYNGIDDGGKSERVDLSGDELMSPKLRAIPDDISFRIPKSVMK